MVTYTREDGAEMIEFAPHQFVNKAKAEELGLSIRSRAGSAAVSRKETVAARSAGAGRRVEDAPPARGAGSPCSVAAGAAKGEKKAKRKEGATA